MPGAAVFVVIALLVACGQPPAPVAEPPKSAAAELDALDARRPLPLLPMMALHQKEQMRGHLEAVQQAVQALATEDWDGLEAAAVRMGSSPGMSQVCAHMGAAAEGFTEQALDFHRRADAIAEAARSRDTTAALRATSHTLQACADCHAAWRQQVVTEAEYAALGVVAPHAATGR